MKLKNWKKTDVGFGWSYDSKTDFQNNRPYQDFSVYIYKKGHFRDYENNVVIKIHEKTPTKDRIDKFYFFTSEKEAIKEAVKYIKKHENKKSGV